MNDDASRSSNAPASSGEAGWFSRLQERLRMSGRADLRTDIEDALASDESFSDIFSPEERTMLRNILRLREVGVDDVMVTRADIDAVEVAIPLGQLLKTFQVCGHSRMPVYGETLDAPLGMIHIKDVMSYMTRLSVPDTADSDGADSARAGELHLESVDLSTPLSELNLVRQVLFVPPSMPASDLLATMQATHIQMALVIDEYGGTDGLVSLEDVVETVVGNIEDEHDEDETPLLQHLGEGVYVADAKVDLDDMQALLGDAFQIGEHGEDVDTLGGLLFTLLGRVPVRGEVITSLEGYEFEILDADPRRIKRLKLSPAGKQTGRKRRKTRASLVESPDETPVEGMAETLDQIIREEAEGVAAVPDDGKSVSPPAQNGEEAEASPTEKPASPRDKDAAA